MSKSKAKNSQLKLLFLCAEILLAVVALVLLMATPGVKYSLSTLIGGVENPIAGIACIFGSSDPKVNLTWTGLLSFIFIAVAVVLLCVLCVFLVTKKNFAFANLCKIIIAGLLIAAGVFVFFTVPAFTAVNNNYSVNIGGNQLSGYGLGAGWIIGAIVSIAAGAIAGVEVALDK